MHQVIWLLDELLAKKELIATGVARNRMLARMQMGNALLIVEAISGTVALDLGDGHHVG